MLLILLNTFNSNLIIWCRCFKCDMPKSWSKSQICGPNIGWKNVLQYQFCQV